MSEHRHGDIEINYCLEGHFSVLIDKKPYTVTAGQFSLIGPMVSHEYRNSLTEKRRVLTVIVGISFLKNHFAKFSKIPPDLPILTPDPRIPSQKKLIELLEETAALCENREERRELLIQGNLYKIFDYLLRMVPNQGNATKDMRKVENVEKALSLIYYHYAENVTVEDAALLSGYGKSNFCKIFKGVTGSTFHTLLNRRRVEVACDLLSETNLPLSEIGVQVGLSEPKTLCRIFRSVMGTSPGAYRREHRPSAQ